MIDGSKSASRGAITADEYRESRRNRSGDGIWAAVAGSGRDRAGTLPAEG